MAEYHRFRDDPMMLLKRNLGFVYKYSFAWVFSYFFSSKKSDIESDLPSFLPNVRQYDKDIKLDTVLPKGIYKLMWGLAGWDLLKVSGFVLGKKFCDMMVISKMWTMSDQINKGQGDLGLLISTLPSIYILDFFGILFLSYAELLSLEIGFSLRATLCLLVYRKALKVRILYNKEFQEAVFVGMTQTDTPWITNIFDIVKNYIEGILNIVIFAIWGGMYFGFPIIILVTIFLVQQLLSIYLVDSLSDYQRQFLAGKGERTKHIKSLLNCMPLVKIIGLESLMFLNITLGRIKEMTALFQSNIRRSLVTCINWGSVYLAFVCMLIYLFATGRGIEYSFMVPMTKMMMLLFYTTGAIPKATETSISLRISFERLENFLNMEEITPLRVKELAEEEAPLNKPVSATPINLINCQFSWKKPAAPPPTPAGTEMKQIKDKTFKLENVNLKLNKGELVVIMGRVGSGKSSLLLALFNEMQLMNPKESSKVVSNNCIYLAQKPWILNKTIKENIILDHEFNEELFRLSLQVAGLTEEVAKMPQKEDTYCGKRGEQLSGGQRWLIALARAFYQQ
jgi:ABC-type multidrug transport system fused ATPase/permease subunit